MDLTECRHYKMQPATCLTKFRPTAISNPSIIDHPSGTESHMDIHQLDDAIRRYFAAALARSTHKMYAAAERRYLNFCKDFNLIPLPVSESTLCYFVACLFSLSADQEKQL